MITVPTEYRVLQAQARGAVLFYKWFDAWLVADPHMDTVLSVWINVTWHKGYITIADAYLDDTIKMLLAAGHKCAIAEPVKQTPQGVEVDRVVTQGSLF